MSTVIRNNLIKCKCMNSRWRTDAILEKAFLAITWQRIVRFSRNFVRRCKISEQCQKFQTLNIQDGRQPAILKITESPSYISAKYHQILTKFCLKTHIIFVKNWSIYVKPRTKWSAAHSTLSVEYTSPANMFIFRYSSVCLTVTFSFTQYWNVVKSLYFPGKLSRPLTLLNNDVNLRTKKSIVKVTGNENV